MSTQIDFDFEAPFTKEVYTPYALAKVVNEIVVRQLRIREKELPPQMFYNYSKNGMLDGVKGSKQISRENAIAFTKKYVLRAITK